MKVCELNTDEMRMILNCLKFNIFLRLSPNIYKYRSRNLRITWKDSDWYLLFFYLDDEDIFFFYSFMLNKTCWVYSTLCSLTGQYDWIYIQYFFYRHGPCNLKTRMGWIIKGLDYLVAKIKGLENQCLLQRLNSFQLSS